jgi:hypothetical protein
MNKPLCIVSCPIDCYSGYSARSVDFVKALIQSKPDWNIQILSQRWGNTRFGYLEDHKEYDLISRIIPQMTQQPDYWFQITVPNEFQKVGKVFSCGVTAGIETTVCDPSWIEGVNRMDVVLVSSQHAKTVFENSKFEKRDQNKQQILGVVELNTPVEILFEGLDLNKYFYIDQSEYPKTDFTEELDLISEKFNFLFIGHWLQGDMGEDRKNVPYLIKTFLLAFKNKHLKPGLILKTSSATSSVIDRDTILKNIDSIRESLGEGEYPNIYLIHGDLEDADINLLYNHSKVKAMVSLTKGEGFGRPLLEFTQSKKIVAASDWSGHKDFLDPKFSYLVPGVTKPVHPSAVVPNLILGESEWFSPNDTEVITMWNVLYKNIKDYEVPAKRQAHKSKTEFSFEAMVESLKDIIETNFPKPKVLTLPTLKKLDLPKLNKI